MKLTVNGIELNVDDAALTLSELLVRREVLGKPIAVELNGLLIKKGEYELTGLKDGDRIEIVSFVGGG